MKTLLVWSCWMLCLWSPFALLASGGADNNPSQRINGVYLVSVDTLKERSHVRISCNADGLFEGRVIWMNQPKDTKGNYVLDLKNPNPALRNQRLDQIVILRNLRYNPKTNEWINGEIYNPLNGKYYRVFAEFMPDGRLKLRGFIGVALLGKTMYWYRLQN